MSSLTKVLAYKVWPHHSRQYCDTQDKHNTLNSQIPHEWFRVSNTVVQYLLLIERSDSLSSLELMLLAMSCFYIVETKRYLSQNMLGLCIVRGLLAE